MAMKNPPHPGGFVLRQCIEPLGLTIKDAAAALLRLSQGCGSPACTCGLLPQGAHSQAIDGMGQARGHTECHTTDL